MTHSIKNFIEETEKEFIEAGANIEHDRWARWQKYMFSKGDVVTGTRVCKEDFVLPKEFVDRWFRQIDITYSKLSKEEKESDRKETRNYLPLLRIRQAALLDVLLEELPKEKMDRTMKGFTGEVSITRIEGYNSCLQEVKEKLLEVKKQL